MCYIVFCHFVCLFIFFYLLYCFFFFSQKTAYEMRISDWSSDVCSSDLDMVERFDFGVARCWYDGEIHDTPEAATDRANKTVTLFLDDRLERSRARFARFNERMGGDWRLIDDFQV